MIELPLIFTAGILGTAHCLGMCGPFALAVSGGARSWADNLARQITYTLGRTFTYCVLGAAAGFGGLRLTQLVPWLIDGGAILAIAGGLWLLIQGLRATGVWKQSGRSPSGPCLAGDLFRSMLRLPGISGVFVAGLFTGLIPCGLVYGMLALAGATSDLWHGAATMGVFGLGTAPVMIAAGCGGSLMSLGARVRIFRFAAWCLVLTGAISMVRGATYLQSPTHPVAAKCPFCR
jgi:sulfite exporter TauE/SafE